MKLKLLSFLGAIFTSFIFSQTQNCLDFDGTNDFVQTTYAGVLGSSDRTFEAWVNFSSNAPSTNLAIIDYGAGSSGSRNTFMINSNRGLSFISGGTNANLSSTSTGIITADTWTHVAFVLDNGTGYLYVDGAEVGTGNLSGVNTTSSTDLRIGQRVPGGTIRFLGKIDEVRIWNVALSPSEIMANMNSEICPSTAGLTAYYQFNEGMDGADNTTVDTLPELVAGNDGVLNNFTLNGATSNWVSGSTALASFAVDTSVTESNGVLTAQQSGATYAWIDCGNDSFISGETAASYTPTAVGDYSVEITYNGCVLQSDCITVSSLGVTNNQLLDNLSISKNPSQVLSFNRMIETDAKVSIHSLSGKELFVATMSDAQTFSPSIASGLYLVTVTQNNASKTFKWIKE
ncbi:LamG-like jellyroll fold domain-containing protein [Winogradskyella endarachnes]|uniref:T9SS type A sorting domain-containing protein n=1 Tax=Winogradskyella endarachnes TaxID=2681965 RepID=A0A6L6U6H0_9FLAO|nr:LamG-like jellyroll fold domain-containing protein [Winogradskyella endarachnes]MUU77549.1 T9SS type A sorting domain-containing protein [Winogradskyella endarachnes]